MTNTARDLVHSNASEISGALGLHALNNKFNLAGARISRTTSRS